MNDWAGLDRALAAIAAPGPTRESEKTANGWQNSPTCTAKSTPEARLLLYTYGPIRETRRGES